MGKTEYLLGSKGKKIPQKTRTIAYHDPKISFFCKYAKNKSVLDLGCIQHNPENCFNEFWLHGAIRAVASECVGLDLYADGVDYLNQLGYKVVCADAEDFNLDRQFDVICAGDLIEHLGNPSKMIECVKNHLSPRGFFILSTPNPWHWTYILRGIFLSETKPNPEHACWFCTSTLKQLLKRHGFEVVEIFLASRHMKDHLLIMPGYSRYRTINVATILHA